MDRRGFLIGAGVLVAAGCARVQPAVMSGAPTPTPTDAGTLIIGTDQTPAGAMLSETLAQALIASGRNASVAPVAADWLAALGDGSLAALPAYAGTLWADLSDDDEPPVADRLVSDVASLVAPEVSTLTAAGVDGGLVWLVTRRTAAGGITALDKLAKWSSGRTAAVPSLARARADGVPGVEAAYGAAFDVTEIDDPIARAARLVDGRVDVAAFRRTEYTAASGLVALGDPDELGAADPLVLLLHAGLADAEPEAVLTMGSVAELLTTDRLLDLQAKVVGGEPAAAVARAWLGQNGLA